MEKILLDTNMFIYLEDYAVTEDKVATLTKRLFDSDQYKIVIHPKTKEEILKSNIDLILLDINIPYQNREQLLKEIRKESNIPVIIVTSRANETDEILSISYGKDDYITKPFSVRELLARVKANMRRSDIVPQQAEVENDIVEIGCFTLDCNRYELYKNGKLIDLTVREFELIKFLSAQPNKIYSRKSLLEYVWDYEYYGDVRTVDVTVRRVREKIEDDPSQPKHIMTKRGVGYYFAI